MDSNLDVLASTATTTLAQLLVTDAWEQAKNAVVALWRRVRPAHADTVASSLDDTRAALLAGDDAAVRGHVCDWQDRLVGTGDPDLVRELLDALANLESVVPPRTELRARASGHGRVYQSGRDMSIAEG
jgi:hypothetical protein